MENTAQPGQKLKHLPTGKTGIYVEHLNIGEGYMVRTDEGKILVGKYKDFEIEEE